MTTVTVFAPATVSNVACGFDVLGFALHEPGDEVTARLTTSGVAIDAISGDDGRLPREAGRNTAGVAALALLTSLGESRGVALTISTPPAGSSRPRAETSRSSMSPPSTGTVETPPPSAGAPR